MAAFGFSINTLTMFGMVLAIGLLVDDAIVVVENVERVMTGGPAAARRRRKVDGPDHRRADRHRPGAVGGVRADGLLRRLDRRDLPPVLITIVSAMAPVGAGGHRVRRRCAPPCLKPVQRATNGEGGLFGRFFHWFNLKFGWHPALSAAWRHPPAQRALPRHLPRHRRGARPALRAHADLLPAREDQGVMFNQVMLPAGATRSARSRCWRRSSTTSSRTKGHRARVFTVAGFSFGGSGPEWASAVNLKHWDERKAPGRT